jgi:hypothetical protein
MTCFNFEKQKEVMGFQEATCSVTAVDGLYEASLDALGVSAQQSKCQSMNFARELL